MEHHDLLRDLLILFGFATVAAVALQRARQSTVVAYLLTGILVGPSGLQLITNREAIELMAEVGVVLLLFTIGIEFSLKKLVQMRQVVLGAGSRQVGLTILVTLLLAFAVGLAFVLRIGVGIALAHGLPRYGYDREAQNAGYVGKLEVKTGKISLSPSH